MLPLPILLGGGGLAAYAAYEYMQGHKDHVLTNSDGTPQLQSMKTTTPPSSPVAPAGMPVQVVVPVTPKPPILSMAATPLHPNNTGTGASYAPVPVIKAGTSPSALKISPMLITPSGVTNMDVQTAQDIQNALNTLGFGPLKIDGIVGPSTINAIKGFQNKYHYAPDGSASQTTRSQLQSVIAQVAASAANTVAGSSNPIVQSATPVVAAAGGGSPIAINTNKDVQHALNLLGASPALVEDGSLGPKSTAAVKAFQISHGLVSDGIPGPKTKTALALALTSGVSMTGEFGFGYEHFDLGGFEHHDDHRGDHDPLMQPFDGDDQSIDPTDQGFNDIDDGTPPPPPTTDVYGNVIPPPSVVPTDDTGEGYTPSLDSIQQDFQQQYMGPHFDDRFDRSRFPHRFFPQPYHPGIAPPIASPYIAPPVASPYIAPPSPILARPAAPGAIAPPSVIKPTIPAPIVARPVVAAPARPVVAPPKPVIAPPKAHGDWGWESPQFDNRFENQDNRFDNRFEREGIQRPYHPAFDQYQQPYHPEFEPPPPYIAPPASPYIAPPISPYIAPPLARPAPPLVYGDTDITDTFGDDYGSYTTYTAPGTLPPAPPQPPLPPLQGTVGSSGGVLPSPPIRRPAPPSNVVGGHLVGFPGRPVPIPTSTAPVPSGTGNFGNLISQAGSLVNTVSGAANVASSASGALSSIINSGDTSNLGDIMSSLGIGYDPYHPDADLGQHDDMLGWG